jgi:hypothetical protein
MKELTLAMNRKGDLPFFFLTLFSCDITVNVFLGLSGKIAMRARSYPL